MPNPLQPRQAVSRLKTDALGVGERHTKPAGREFTKLLLKQPNLVRALFVEVNSSDQDFLDKTAESAKNPELEKVLGRIGPDYSYKNSTPLYTVIALAIRSGIPVFGLDVQAGWVDFEAHNVSVEKIEAKHGVIKNTTPPGMTIRDAHAAGLFKKIVANDLGGSRAGCLVLYGAQHFQDGLHHRPGVSLAHHLNFDYVLFI